jgi:hypothetical protein
VISPKFPTFASLDKLPLGCFMRKVAVLGLGGVTWAPEDCARLRNVQTSNK